MSSPAPIEREAPGDWLPRSVYRRRVAAAAARRRRLLLIDLALGLLLALMAIVIAPGLAIAAIVALFVMLGYAATLIFGRVRRRRAGRKLRPH